MPHPFYKTAPKTYDSSICTAILTDWVQAVSTFYQHYQQLATYRIRQSIPLIQPIPVSQCPLGHLEHLMDDMQRQIESLLLEMGDAEPSPSSQASYQKLIDHTARLNRVNQHAQTLGLLTTLSPS
ncbi:hypothetical protein [Spirosoma validum]|uniref:Uncharacterized protein n=1 Tax=Spirosoma validum TaxID=2771355 RepID=A0A927B3Z7_9BACT|nr:hypothetical protein [Spirosoma validum]MBD2754980.1 hypothetical protein [Spirosoma validum]